ncbi:MAG: Tellurium resistance protein TerA [Alphaproteobacteria bacterium]
MSKTPPMGTSLSENSMIEATRDRAKFSGHGEALGAAGVKEASTDPANSPHLSLPGQSIAVNARELGYEAIKVAATWSNVEVEEAGIVGKLIKKTLKMGVDLDLGCLYELTDGTRGAIQAFGDKFGSLDKPPYMQLSGDDRTGNAKGFDEWITVNPKHWNDIKRILVYIYIYEGAPNWAVVNPRIILNIPGEKDLTVSLTSYNEKLSVCAVGGLENISGGIKLTNYTEYFPGQEEMDRAFGFGLDWTGGEK